jgi:sodium/hydrogen antiporter
LLGTAFGPEGPLLEHGRMGIGDNITQEATRIIVGVQVFAVGIELPKKYMKGHWRSIGVLLRPAMATGWIISALIIYFILQTKFTTALITSA